MSTHYQPGPIKDPIGRQGLSNTFKTNPVKPGHLDWSSIKTLLDQRKQMTDEIGGLQSSVERKGTKISELREQIDSLKDHIQDLKEKNATVNVHNKRRSLEKAFGQSLSLGKSLFLVWLLFFGTGFFIDALEAHHYRKVQTESLGDLRAVIRTQNQGDSTVNNNLHNAGQRTEKVIHYQAQEATPVPSFIERVGGCWILGTLVVLGVISLIPFGLFYWINK